jgi:23S rRNA (cytosine1962-C5)-methyltransferase
MPNRWGMDYKGLKFWAQLTTSRHVGVFPEQAAEWDWISQQMGNSPRPLKVLNLFGYTALATLAAARLGAQVTHVDASSKVITWAKENQRLSRLGHLPIRWIVDDVLKFVQREGRRRSLYDGIILDPPKFGRGPRGEVWEFYKLIPNLLDACRQILNPEPKFILMTTYAVKSSSLTLIGAVQEMLKGKAGETTAGELVLLEKGGGRILSMAVYCAWSAVGKSKILNPHNKQDVIL